MMGTTATWTTWFCNGYANQYVEKPIAVKAGEPIRIFLVNAGPNAYSTFHVNAIFDRVCVNANPYNELFGLQSWTVGLAMGPASNSRSTSQGFTRPSTIAFGHAAHGAIALLQAE